MDQAHPGDDENSAHDQRAQNSPEQHAVLLLLGHGEKVEDHEEDEQVVDAQRELDNIAGDELQCDLVPLPEIERWREGAARPT